MLLITGADQALGHSIISHLSRYENARSQIRALCQNQQPCINFANKGVDVRQVEYHHPHQLSLAMRGVDHMILTLGNEFDRLEHAKYVCQTAIQSGVKSIIFVSHVGAVSHAHPSLQHYAEIEDQVVNSDCDWIILRPEWINQNFHLWASYVEKHRRFPLPIPDDTEICPIDMSDICKVIEELVLDRNKNLVSKLEDDHIGQVYTLTGPQSVTGKQIMEMLCETTGYTKLTFEPTRSMDIRYYLENLRRDIWFDARLKQENRQIYHDTFEGYSYRTKAFAIPTATQISTYLDYFDWVHKSASSICVPHASVITSLPCRSLRKFFQENANSFKPRV
ncbi:uncharacterized protein BYT42DRAFT_543288 [Radiomyces spectabilis]|uniref:uncharacterized protein n=1 Tax=Radiomyces spectabilis TaxID=64574 RepID=UPI002220820D|nr:uncharacterized protein BYT42DRAFT_543288 [Radiomyces spectabilis]KAI8391795.1 hypothetical protein BYT42DRAFT_543288 [Radiomyces spectabilis]